MEKTNEIIAKVTGNINVLIKGNTNDVNLNEPFFAINWFSTKIEWLYHFYNFLARSSVTKVGGKAFFKGKITETIIDEGNAVRELLLIVKYPGGQNFKRLMESTYFKAVSIFRILSVKKFTFGFTKNHTLNDTSQLADNLVYAVHHFKSKNINDGLFSKVKEQLGAQVKIKYAGSVIANLYSQQKNEPAQTVPNLMDGVIIFEAVSKDSVLEMLQSKNYKKIIEELDSSYIGFLNRTL